MILRGYLIREGVALHVYPGKIGVKKSARFAQPCLPNKGKDKLFTCLKE